MDLVDVRIQTRERVERAARLHTRNARNHVQSLPSDVALLEQAAAGQDQVFDALVTAEGDLNGVLSGDVGAQTGRRQEIESLEEAGRVILRARDRHPAGAVAGDAVGLREAVERQAQQIRGKCCQRDVLGVVVEDLVVDLVGEQQKLMLACQIDQLLQKPPSSTPHPWGCSG